MAAIRYTTDGSDPAGPTGTVYTSPFTVSQTTTVNYAATDNAGNTSPTGSQLIQVDTTAPTAQIESPLNGARVTGTIKIKALAADNVGVARVSFFLDGRLLGTSTTAPYTLSWNTKKAGKGTHTLSVEAVDAAGNVTRSSPITVTVR